MLAEADQHPLDAFVPDPTGKPALGSEEKFTAILEGMVADNAPRVFAVVQEYGDRVDARIAAWGMSFEDDVDIVGVDGTMHIGVPSPEQALRCFAIGTRITPRLVWVNPDAATPRDDDPTCP